MFPIRFSAFVAGWLFTATLFLCPTKGASQQKPQPADTGTPSPWPIRFRCCATSNFLGWCPSQGVAGVRQQGTTVYMLPVWVVARVETLTKAGQWEELLPGKALPAKAAAPAPRLRIQLVNLLAQPDTRAVVEQRLREQLAKSEGLKPEQFKLRSPTFRPQGFRLALAAPGATGNAGEVLLADPIILPPTVAEDSGRVTLELLPDAIAGLQAAHG